MVCLFLWCPVRDSFETLKMQCAHAVVAGIRLFCTRLGCTGGVKKSRVRVREKVGSGRRCHRYIFFATLLAEAHSEYFSLVGKPWHLCISLVQGGRFDYSGPICVDAPFLFVFSLKEPWSPRATNTRTIRQVDRQNDRHPSFYVFLATPVCTMWRFEIQIDLKVRDLEPLEGPPPRPRIGSSSRGVPTPQDCGVWGSQPPSDPLRRRCGTQTDFFLVPFLNFSFFRSFWFFFGFLQ